jgi:hypothetical protein
MAGLTFDSGALIAAERGKRRFWSLWAEAFCRETPAVIPAPALAQVWRDPPGALRARVVRGAVVELLDSARARLTGMLWSRTGSSDVVDAAVVCKRGAARRPDPHRRSRRPPAPRRRGRERRGPIAQRLR